jgi:tape measure domain-containing protein
MAKTGINTGDSLAQIKALVAEFKKLQTSAQKTTTNFNDLKSVISQMAKTSKMTTTQFQNLKSSLDKNATQLKRNTAALRSDRIAVNQLTKSNYKLVASNKANVTSTKRVTQATKTSTIATKKATTTNLTYRQSFVKISSSLKNLAGAFGILIGVQAMAGLLSLVLKTTKALDSMKFTLKAVTKSSIDTTISLGFLKRITQEYGLSLTSTASRFSKFLAASKEAGFSLSQTQEIFENVSKAAGVLGLKTDEVSGVYLALEQMISKGKVTTEELRRQLGERLPGAMDILAKTMGVTTSELDKMLKKGEVITYEVLPDFAKAIGEAYDVDGKIDTVVAAQNRVKNAWDEFILGVEEGSGIISSFFKELFLEFELILKYFGKINETEESYLKSTLFSYYETEMNNFENNYLEFFKRYKRIGKEFSQIEFAEIQVSDLGKKLIEEEKLVVGMSKRLAIQKEMSAKQIEYNNLVSGVGLTETQKLRRDTLKIELKGAKEVLKTSKKARRDVAQLRGRIKAYQEMVKNLTPRKEGGDEEDGTRKVNLKNIKDLEPRIQAEKLRSSIELNKKLLKSDELLYEDKKNLLIDNSNYEISIAKILKNEKIDLAESEYKRGISSLKTYLEENKITQEEYNKQSILLKTQQNQKIELAELESVKRIRTSKLNLSKNTDAINKEINKKEIAAIKEKYDLQVIELNKEYELSEKSAKDFEQLERKKRDLALTMANEIITAQITALQAIIDAGHLSEEAIEGIEQAILSLEASREKLKPAKGSEESWQEWGENVRDIISSVGELLDAFTDSRIEAVEAEIRAEEKKYERFLELAGDDASKKATLEKERDAKIEKLEKKRLKEEQRQAKIRKLFALADIGMNTALAISRAKAAALLLGPVAGPPWFLSESGFITALGAIQAATVLATPIPQYAQGVENLGQDETAMINDGGKKEYVERNGKILSTNTKNAIVSLKKGDTVHKDYDSMVKNSIIYSAIGGGNSFSQFEFDRLSDTIESSITKGFNKAKINNRLTINNGLTNQYLNEKSRFNG